jgi:protein-S-isoprenylcysteine O-methyltransferase Ste14
MSAFQKIDYSEVIMSITDIFVLISVVWVLSEIILAIVLHSNRTDKSRDKYSLAYLWFTIIVSITAGSMTASMKVGYIPGIFRITAYIGLFFVLFGLVVRWIAILTLRRYFTVNVAIRKDHKIVNNGLYKTIRHPAYSGNLLSFFGLAVYFANWLTFIIIFVPVLCAFLYRIKIEEEALIAQFGKKYIAYKEKTNRLIPYLW